MQWRIFSQLFLALGVLAPAGAAPAGADMHFWGQVKTPTQGLARAVGGHAAGCLAGAAALPLDGPGYAVVRAGRNRFWGHPNLIRVIRALGRHVQRDTGRVLLIADMGAPRGGPIDGHVSHQLGLDADIRFLLLPRNRITPRLRADPPDRSALNRDRTAPDRAVWSAAHLRLVRAAASFRLVERIFVHPVIKRELCRTASGDRRWLAKVRAWYGHHAHMHVRLGCPADSPDCRPQLPLRGGDGCGKALAWWFTPEARQTRPKPRRSPPKLPGKCAAVLGN